MFNWNDYGNGIYGFDSGYVRPLLAAIQLIVEGSRCAIIDTGSNDSVDNIVAALHKVGLSEDAVDYVILTHIHLDHAGGAGLLMQKCPNAKLVVHPRGARHMAEPSKLIEGVSAVYGAEYVQKVYGKIMPIAAERIIEAPDNTIISLNKRELLCIDTPGHARHHICIIDKQTSSIFTGDMFGLSYRELDVNGKAFIFPTTTPTQFDPEAMRQSIARLLSYQPKTMYLTHYSAVSEPETLAKDLLAHIDALVNIAENSQKLGLDNDARHQHVTSELKKYLLEQVHAFGCTLPEAEILEIFATDLELNAQGMTYWQDSLSHA